MTRRHGLIITLSALLLGALVAFAAAPPPALADDAFKDYFDGRFGIGFRANYWNQDDADDATWFAGTAFRWRLSDPIALEASVDGHRDEFEHGDIEVFTIPVQASLLLYPLGNARLSPYGIGGMGWYFTHINYEGALDDLDDDTDNRFGLHAGGGLDFALTPKITLNGDLRYVWLDKFETDDEDLLDKEFDQSGPMVTMGVTFYF
jgi:opacity protein-like surface antigen